jgi:4'-phosphopantetheinyl transferase
MDVYWLEQTEADLPAENDWLSAPEALQLRGMRIAKRRADWRLGRWTAKCAVSVYLGLPSHPSALADIEIRPAPSGAPEVFLVGQAAAATISLSHRAGAAVCAVAAPGVALGCDLEMIEPRSDAFIADYFTTEEQALVARASAADRPRLLTLLWSGKESALKALGAGLRFDTRCVVVSPVDGNRSNYRDAIAEDPPLAYPPLDHLPDWQPLQVRHANGQVFHGWWQHRANLVRTLVAAPPPVQPIVLKEFAHAERGSAASDNPHSNLCLAGIRNSCKCLT